MPQEMCTSTEHENHRVQKFRITQSGGVWNAEVLAGVGRWWLVPGQFNTPYGIALDVRQRLGSPTASTAGLQRFTPNGDLLSQVGVRGATEPHLVATWLAFDATGDIYVSVTSDPNTEAISRISGSRNFRRRHVARAVGFLRAAHPGPVPAAVRHRDRPDDAARFTSQTRQWPCAGFFAGRRVPTTTTTAAAASAGSGLVNVSSRLRVIGHRPESHP